jgi:hypothetical protein
MRWFAQFLGALGGQSAQEGWKGGVGVLQYKLHRVPPTQKGPARAIGLGREVVTEVVLLVACQKMARIDAKGVVALVADHLLFTEWNDGRDPIGKAAGGSAN